MATKIAPFDPFANYEPTTDGARIRIVSGDPIAIAAVQDFLRFQIIDHVTGDSPATFAK